jgi:predicted RecA/RadA family phage recombinase
MAEATYVQPGESIDYTPSTNVALGTVVVLGDLVGVTKRDIRANELGALALSGVFDVAKGTSEALAVGTTVYWDDTNHRLTATAGSHKRFGNVVRAAAADDPTVRARLGS